MKRNTLLVLLLFVSINIFAQIQRTFMGCPFGSTKQFVLQKMKARGYDIKNKYDGYIVNSTKYNQISFGGYNWDQIQFSFYQNALCDIVFVNYSDMLAKERLKEFFLLLKDKLELKYANYADPQIGDNIYSWSDGKTGVIDRYAFIDKDGSVVEEFAPVTKKVMWALLYYDLLSKKSKDEDSEL